MRRAWAVRPGHYWPYRSGNQMRQVIRPRIGVGVFSSVHAPQTVRLSDRKGSARKRLKLPDAVLFHCR